MRPHGPHWFGQFWQNQEISWGNAIFLQEISWYLISCFLFSCQEMCHSNRYLPHYTHSNRLKQVQLTDYLCWFRWQEADRQLEAAVWPSSWPRDYLNETFWSAPYIGVTYHWIGRHEHPSIRKDRKDCQKRPILR